MTAHYIIRETWTGTWFMVVCSCGLEAGYASEGFADGRIRATARLVDEHLKEGAK